MMTHNAPASNLLGLRRTSAAVPTASECSLLKYPSNSKRGSRRVNIRCRSVPSRVSYAFYQAMVGKTVSGREGDLQPLDRRGPCTPLSWIGRIRSESLMRRILGTLLLVFVSAVSVRNLKAEDWAKAMFDHTSHDFGMVARGANAEHRFPLENIYLEDAHIKSVSSSCTCTSVRVTEPSLKTYDKSEVVATLNTRQFTGRKDATIRVVFDKPFPAEVQIHCYSYIRTDVVFEPGEVTFGQVPEGAEIEKQITLSHAGAPSWRITGVKNDDPNLGVTIEPLTQTASQSTYLLKFKLKASAPPGYIRGHVSFVTNDAKEEAQQLLVAVQGEVVPAVAMRPSPLDFRQVRSGTSMTRNVVIQGQQPFQILEVAGPDDRFSFGAARSTSASLHLVPVTFSAGAQAGKINGQILIRTDIGGGRILRLEVVGEVVAPPGAAPAAPASAAPASAAPDSAAPDAPVRSAEPATTNTDEGWKNANHSS